MPKLICHCFHQTKHYISYSIPLYYGKSVIIYKSPTNKYWRKGFLLICNELLLVIWCVKLKLDYTVSVNILFV